ILDEVTQIEPPSQGEAVVLAAELEADHLEVAGQLANERSCQLHAAGQSWHENQWWPRTPDAEPCRVMLEVRRARVPCLRSKCLAAHREPIARCLHCSLPAAAQM